MDSMLEIAIDAAREAGLALAEAYNKPHEIIVKGLRDITTEADLRAEEISLRIIRDRCPGAMFESEESYDQDLLDSDARIWYVDPLDGTSNYARGLPGFSVSVAMGQNGQIECGAVYDPMLEHMFYAQRGAGAYLNSNRLQVSSSDRLIDCVVLLDWPRDQILRETAARFLTRVAPSVDTVRSRGSAALGLCYVAAGWADAYYQYTLKSWDVAAGVLLVEEAGGRISDLRGQPARLNGGDWLATNGLVHHQILALSPFG
jgi:myo-inositol-1(or 4)-monophosphatase